ncbi:MAG TPA: hypothetical protein VGN16_10875 [Acidobacteriaceae bacterium]|jgi:hypothetical protein
MTPGDAKSNDGRRGRKAPIRGTQSFVGVMARVWKRPLLVFFEVVWRWSFGLVLVGLAVWEWGAAVLRNLEGLNFDDLESVALSFQLFLQSHGVARLSGVTRHSAELAVAVCIAWILASAAGRGNVLRHLDPALKSNLPSLLVLSVLRVLSFGAVLGIWVLATSAAVQHFAFEPFYARHDPEYVQLAAVVIFGTLALFVLWMVVSYVFSLAPVLSMANEWGAWRSMRESLRRTPLQGKLIEINLVMGIVKIALLVLALVFSACPLPFSSVETQAFLTCWWVGCGVWYLLASDYFHVVRTAAYLSLWRVYNEPETTR